MVVVACIIVVVVDQVVLLPNAGVVTSVMSGELITSLLAPIKIQLRLI